MNQTCPECKNELNLADVTNLKEGQIIECDMCGITLAVVANNDGNVMLEVADEGK
ncbi:lysine biosynthesis protein LysW [Candidatus Nomurabacteria bacterium]|nr:lysine biosynthesis protein LysW [Candidatus Nomurabacteria bacterium]